MKKVYVTLCLLGFIISMVSAQVGTNVFSDAATAAKNPNWRISSYAKGTSWWGENQGDTSEIRFFYYNASNPMRLDSLRTNYNSQGLSVSTECYVYSDTPEYHQVETLYFDRLLQPGRKLVQRYTHDDLLFYEASYATQSPDAELTSLREYYYDDAGRKISGYSYSFSSSVPPVANLVWRANWEYESSGLLAQNSYYYPGNYPNDMKYVQYQYSYNSAGKQSEETYITSPDSLNWNMGHSIYTSYAMSNGALMPAEEVYYSYDVDSVDLFRTSVFSYTNNNLTVDISQTYPRDSSVGSEKLVYNEANLLLKHNTLIYDAGGGIESHLSQTWETFSAADDPVQPPHTISIKSYPNPFNPSTTISYTLPAPANTVVELFNIKGQKVSTLVNEYQSSGLHQHVLAAESSTMASGVYFVRLSSGSFTGSAKLLLMK